MSPKEELIKVPKLLKDGSNWVTYQDQLHWALDACGVLEHIEFSIPEPKKDSGLKRKKGKSGDERGEDDETKTLTGPAVIEERIKNFRNYLAE